MENLNPSVVRLSGVLLISGAVTFWSMIIAAIVYQMRTGSLLIHIVPFLIGILLLLK